MWKDQRKFLHEKLRNFGMTYMGAGKKVMESRIMVSTTISACNLLIHLIRRSAEQLKHLSFEENVYTRMSIFLSHDARR